MTQCCRQRTLQRHHRTQRDEGHQDQCDDDGQCALPHDLGAHPKEEQRAQRDQQDSLRRYVLSVPLLSELVLVVHALQALVGSPAGGVQSECVVGLSVSGSLSSERGYPKTARKFGNLLQQGADKFKLICV